MRAILMLGAAIGLAASAMLPSAASAQTGYAAVWRPGTGTQWWRSGMTLDEFKAQDRTYFDQGLRIKSFAIRNGRFAAVWRTGSGTQWWSSGMTLDEFKAKDRTYFDQGLRIAAMEIENGRFAAVWRPGSGTQWWRSGMTAEQFDAQEEAYFNQGLRLTSLAIEGSKYAAVWQSGSGTQRWSRGRCVTDFTTYDALYVNQGLRLSFIELQDDASGAYRYPWKSGVSRGVGQGNNNAGGSHTGSQRFAFDFNMSAGTQIRAVRAGRVEWLQENLSRNYNPNQPDSATNQAFPAGSLQNWGNAVRIRHPNGFTSWYFHIQQNGVLVNIGDEVQRGQPIATSGNTGRSSGPHLHFQVQADSTDWGQSVAINFNNCDAPNGGSTVVSNNANSDFP